jgi:uncharacterized protein YjbI with pentapeptide repeats
MGAVGKEKHTAQEGGSDQGRSDQASSDTASLGPKTISIGIGAIVVFVLTALVLSPHKRRGLLDVIDDLGVFVVSLLVTTAFLLVAILMYFVAKKTLWDLLQLLIVPLALAGIGFWFTMQQEGRQHQIEDRRAQEAQKIENQRSQDAALQAYLDQMSQLMLDGDLLRGSDGGSEEVRTLARARTRTVLARLNSRRKGSVVQFLYEADLIDKEHPVVSLSDVGLRDADLSKLVLSGADLSDADLRGADLSGATLNDADLSEADLSEADLRVVKMSGAILSGAHLDYAKMSGAHLPFADLDYADLSGAKMSDANLSNADLREATLAETDLSDADLSDADLSDAIGVTKEQIEEQTSNLERATMP